MGKFSAVKVYTEDMYLNSYIILKDLEELDINEKKFFISLLLNCIGKSRPFVFKLIYMELADLFESNIISQAIAEKIIG